MRSSERLIVYPRVKKRAGAIAGQDFRWQEQVDGEWRTVSLFMIPNRVGALGIRAAWKFGWRPDRNYPKGADLEPSGPPYKRA